MFQAQSWAFVHFLHFGHLLNLPKRYEPMIRYLERVNQGMTVEAACIDAFGLGLEELEREFLKYLGDKKIPVRRIPLSRFDDTTGVAFQPLPNAEKLSLLGELARRQGDRTTPRLVRGSDRGRRDQQRAHHPRRPRGRRVSAPESQEPSSYPVALCAAAPTTPPGSSCLRRCE